MLCGYGCRQEAKFLQSSGKWCCSKHYNQCPEMKRKNGAGSRGKHTGPNTKDWSKNISRATKGKKHGSQSEEHKTNISKSKLGKKLGPQTEEHKRRRIESLIGKTKGISRGPQSKKTKEKKSRVMKEKWKDPNSKLISEDRNKKMSESIKRMWEDLSSVYHTETYHRNLATALNLKPNDSETFLINFLDYLLPDEYEYVGDYRIWINRKNPDFLCKKKKKLIEFFGWVHTKEFRSKYNNDFKTNKEHEEEKINHFKKEGYSTLVLWENDLKDEEKLKERILRFNNEV